MQQRAKPSLTFEIIMVQSMVLREKKKKYKGKNSVNPSQTLENIIVQSMELIGKKNKYKSKKNVNFGKGDALNLAQDKKKTTMHCMDVSFYIAPSSNGCYKMSISAKGN